MYSCLLFISVLLNEIFVLVGLRLTEVRVPGIGIFQESVTLGCDFSLDADQLLSVKWYKDEHEFFSYSPQRSPPIQRFRLPGVFLQSNSSMSRITLVNLTLEAGGNYKCEVSAERPSYQTLSRDGNLTIVAPPDPEFPHLNGFPSTVRLGDTFSGNCTSFRSRPKSTLTFLVNGDQVNPHDLIEYTDIVGIWLRGGELMQLSTSTLGLKVSVGKHHFHQGSLRIRCSASIHQSIKARSAEVTIKPDGYQESLTRIAYNLSNSPRTTPMFFRQQILALILLLQLD